MLDALPDKSAAAQIRDQIADIVEIEGPVEIGRLTRSVARRFGLTTVRSTRAAELVQLVPKQLARTREGGTFIWPSDKDPQTWDGFRIVNPNAPRTLDEIAPEEIANAMCNLAAEEPDGPEAELLRRTAELFGVTRLGSTARARLELAYALVPSRPARSARETSAGASTTDSGKAANSAGRRATGLAKGANVVVVDNGLPIQPEKLVVGIGWAFEAGRTENDPALKADASALVLGSDGRVLSDLHFVFYNNTTTPDHAVTHLGNLPPSEHDRQQITVDLAALPSEAPRLAFVVSVTSAGVPEASFRQLAAAHIRVIDPASADELARFDLDPSSHDRETAMVFGELYRRGKQWKFRAIGQGYESGLRGVATDFGVDIS